MSEISRALAAVLAPRPELGWWVGVVSTTPVGGMCTVTINGGAVPNVLCLKHAVPVIGDVVHGLVFEPYGLVIVGIEAVVAGTLGAAPEPSETVLGAVGAGIWNELSGTWEPASAGDELPMGGGRGGMWFYGSDAFAGLGPPARLALALTHTAGEARWADVLLHGSLGPAGTLVVLDHAIPSQPVSAVAPAEPVLVNLPLGWLDLLADQRAAGVGLSPSALSEDGFTGGQLHVVAL
ncbi:MAG: hypothetical protein WCG47_04940 [Dermatophilaceae bacterium]